MRRSNGEVVFPGKRKGKKKSTKKYKNDWKKHEIISCHHLMSFNRSNSRSIYAWDRFIKLEINIKIIDLVLITLEKKKDFNQLQSREPDPLLLERISFYGRWPIPKWTPYRQVTSSDILKHVGDTESGNQPIRTFGFFLIVFSILF